MIRRIRRWMRSLRRSRSSPPGPELLFVELSGARYGLDYDSEDRRRDFHGVFLGSDAGKRVLYEILAWSNVFASTFVPGDAHATHWREGGRDIGLRILATLNPERPVRSEGRGAAGEADNGNGDRS